MLAAPYHVKGHTVLAAIQKGYKCPQEPSKEVLGGLSTALVNTITILNEHYRPKPQNILLSSVRGDQPHYHFHLIPLYEDAEKKWREDRGLCDKGHLMQFLGDLEKDRNTQVEAERRRDGWSEEEQRNKIIISLDADIQKLRIQCLMIGRNWEAA
jgi:hypothetical protein